MLPLRQAGDVLAPGEIASQASDNNYLMVCLFLVFKYFLRTKYFCNKIRVFILFYVLTFQSKHCKSQIKCALLYT